MRILSPISDDAAGEIGYALLDIPQEVARKFLELRENCKPVFPIKGLYGIDVYDSTPTLHYKRNEDFLDEMEDSGRWQEAPEGFEPEDGSFMSTACEILTVKPSGVIWRLHSKHSSEVFETCEIGWDTIEMIATEAAAPAKNG